LKKINIHPFVEKTIYNVGVILIDYCCTYMYNVMEFRAVYYVCCMLIDSTVTCSVHGLLEGDKFKFNRMPSVDAFNKVLI